MQGISVLADGDYGTTPEEDEELPKTRTGKVRKGRGVPRKASKYSLPEDAPLDPSVPRKRRRGPCPPEERLRQNREAQRVYRQRKDKFHNEVEAAHEYYESTIDSMKAEIARYRKIGLIAPEDIRYTRPEQSILSIPAPEPILHDDPPPAPPIDMALVQALSGSARRGALGPSISFHNQFSVAPSPPAIPPPQIPRFHPSADFTAAMSAYQPIMIGGPPQEGPFAGAVQQMLLGGFGFQPPPLPMSAIPPAPPAPAPVPGFKLNSSAFAAHTTATPSLPGPPDTGSSNLLLRRNMRTAGMALDSILGSSS